MYYSAHGSTELSCDACGAATWRLFEDEVSFNRVAELPRKLSAGDHGVLVYTDVDDAADLCVSYLEEGARRGERTITAVPEALRTAIDSRLSPEMVASVLAFDPVELYRDFEPAAVEERFLALVKESDQPARLLCGPGEDVVSDILLDDWRRWERRTHELALELGATALCVYDSRSLPIVFSSVALESHTLISRNGRDLVRNAEFSYQPISS